MGQRGQRGFMWTIAQDQGRTAQQSATTRPPKGRVAEARAEGGVVKEKQRRQLGRVAARRRRKGQMVGLASLDPPYVAARRRREDRLAGR
jgi:hypothetical protein